MPIKKADPEPLTGPSLQSVNNVFLAAELARLAEDWMNNPYTFGTADLGRYRELCDYFDVDGVSLLHATQNRNPIEKIDATKILSGTLGEVQKSS